MSISFGAFGLMSFRQPVTGLFSIFSGNNDISSVFCLLVFLIVLLVLAYLTNPPESSFRAYLTEQSFRHHLSRLDDSLEDDLGNCKRATLPISRSLAPALLSSSSLYFANRASVSLRTPKHLLNSFGVFTLAAIIPSPKPDPTSNCDDLLIKDSWYIGAFGKWWRGGIMDAWSGTTKAKDEEVYSSGILSVDNLDMLSDFHATHLSLAGFPSQSSSRGTPPRTRNRDKIHYKALPSARSSTPPPLPKSASLPLHNPRTQPLSEPVAALVAQPCTSASDSHIPAPSTSILSYDHHPRIQEIHRLIKNSQTSIRELHAQLDDQHASAYQSHEALMKQVECGRDRKKREDTSRSDIKFRTKSLEDAKRNAESSKRDADKRLKAALRLQQTTKSRAEFLDKEMMQLLVQIEEDQTLVEESKNSSEVVGQECLEELENARQEIRSIEDVIASLHQRARELEHHLSCRRDDLKEITNYNDLRRQEYPSSKPLPVAFEDNRCLALDTSDLSSPSRLSADSARPTTPEVHTMGAGGNVRAYPQVVNSNAITTPDNFATLKEGDPSSHNSGPATLEEMVRIPITSPLATGSSFSPSVAFNGSTDREPLYTPGENLPQVGDWDLKELHPGLPSTAILPTEYSHLEPSGVNHVLTEFGAWADSTNGVVGGATRTESSSIPTRGEHGLRNWFSTGIKGKYSSAPNTDTAIVNPFKKPASENVMLGFGSHIISSTSSLLRAFAPSPAERKRLRALGGSANASFERLPSLSDVSTVPTPSDSPATDADEFGEMGRILPSWLRALSLPNDGRSNFSPWDDDEVLEAPRNVSGRNTVGVLSSS